MAKPADTYANTAQKTGSPRELEAQLLMRAAAKLAIDEQLLMFAKHVKNRLDRTKSFF